MPSWATLKMTSKLEKPPTNTPEPVMDSSTLQSSRKKASRGIILPALVSALLLNLLSASPIPRTLTHTPHASKYVCVCVCV